MGRSDPRHVTLIRDSVQAMAAQKGVDLDKLFSFLSEEQPKSTGGGRDEEKYLSNINQDLDKMMGDEVSGSASGGSKRTAAAPAGKAQTKTPPKQAPAAAKPEASKGKFKWKK